MTIQYEPRQQQGQRQHQGNSTPASIEAPPLEQYAKETIDFGEMLQVAYRRRWLILIGLLVVFILGMAKTLMEKPVFEAGSSILVTSDAAMSMNALVDLQSMLQARSVDTQVEILRSPDLLEKAYAKLPEDVRLKGFGSDVYPGGVKVSSTKNTDIITITVRSQDPQAAADFANSVAETYMEQDLENNKRETGLARAYVERQLKKVEQDFKDANGDLARYKSRTGLVAPDVQLGKFAENLADLQMQLDHTQADAAASTQSLTAIRDELKRMMSNGADGRIETESTFTKNPRVMSVLDDLSELTRKKSALLQDFMPQSPEVLAVDAQITDAQNRLKEQAKSDMLQTSRTVTRPSSVDGVIIQYANTLADLVANTTRVTTYRNEIALRQEELRKLPTSEKRLTELLLNVELQKNAVSLLDTKYQTLLISEEATLPNVRIVAHARPTTVPISPRIKLSGILYFLLGALFGLGLAILAEWIDNRIHDQETAEKLTGLVTMGMVHEIIDAEPKIIPINDKKSQLVERFRVLRNNISFSSLEEPVRMIAVTSSGPAEGKSTCCTNLGVVMAMDGKRVLVVDCDLHRPSMHNRLGVAREVGITNVIMGAATLDAATMATQYEGLYFLSAGVLPSNPSEVLNSQPARQLFAKLATMYDLVILDCPPCVKLSDVQVISTIVDGMLLVVSCNRTAKQGLLYSYRALTQVGASIMGLVMNRVDLSQHRYGYYGYYYNKYDYTRYGNETTDNAKGKKRTKV